MSLRYLAGYITESYNPLKVPNAPTIGTATAGDAQITITFTAPSNVGGGAITSYIAVATKTSDGTAVSATGSASPITITGLTNNSAYTVQVCAVNAFGPGPYSSPSGSVTPVAPKLYSWGLNANGQLGQNDRVTRSSPVQVGTLTNWSKIVGLFTCSMAVKTDGTLWSWGSNGFGQLGQTDTVYRSSPVQVGALTNWSSLGGGSGFSTMIKTDGTLWTCGNNQFGQLGINNRVNASSPVQVGTLSWLIVSGARANDQILAIRTTGTLWAWGQNQQGQLGLNDKVYRSSPVQVGADTNWLIVSTEGTATIAVKTNGTLWAWGNNQNGQLGQNNIIYRSSPVQIGALTNWIDASLGQQFGVALKSDGTLWSWGQNTYGQLGDSSVISRSSPVQIGALTNWSKISSGGEFVLSTKTDGTLWSWGRNNNGQLGQNIVTTTNLSSPAQVGALTTWLAPSTGYAFSMATSS